MNKFTRHEKRQLSAVGVRRWRVAPRHEHRESKLWAVHPVARNRLLSGVLVWARVPFDDGVQYKIRPAVVLECRGREVVILPCTSSPRRQRHSDRPIEILDLEVAGLRRSTGVRRKALRVDYVDVLDVIGRLSELDRARVLPAAVVSYLGA